MKLATAMLVLISASAFAGKITVEGLPVVKTQIKSSLHVPAGVTSDFNRERIENKKKVIAELKVYIETEIGRKVVGDGQCKQIDVRASYPHTGGREGWALDECSVSFL